VFKTLLSLYKEWTLKSVLHFFDFVWREKSELCFIL